MSQHRGQGPWALGFLLACGLSLSACKNGAEARRKAREKALAPYVLSVAPAIDRPLGTKFGEQLTLLGYNLSPGTLVKPGSEIKLTLYWKFNKPLGPGWQLFTHVTNLRGKTLPWGNLDEVGPLRESVAGYPALAPSRWLPGKVYVDVQQFHIPYDAHGHMRIVAGLWNGPSRMAVTHGKKVGKGQARVVTLSLNGRRKVPKIHAIPRMVVPLLTGERPKIDGVLDEPIWKKAARTKPFVNVNTGEPKHGFEVSASGRALYDKDNLYLAFEVQDARLLGGVSKEDQSKNDPHLWEKECIEVMIDPEGNGDNLDYYEIQVSPQNLIFDSQFDAYNLPRKLPNGPFGHQEWEVGGERAVKVLGTLDDDSDRDQGYVVELALPWKSFSKAKQLPPKPGSTWRVNFYAMKRNGGVAWSPILRRGNFHRAARFGRLVWGKSASPSGAGPARSPNEAPAPSSSRSK